MDYAWHEITKGARVIILPPSIDEVLEDNFNYPDYIKKYLKERQKIDYEYLTKLYYREISEDEIVDEGKPLKDMLIELGLNDNFEREIIQIQKIYEDDLKDKKVTLDYNNDMKLVAQKYNDILQSEEGIYDKKVEELDLRRKRK